MKDRQQNGVKKKKNYKERKKEVALLYEMKKIKIQINTVLGAERR